MNCMKGKCIHGSTAKSAIGMMEAEFWKWKGTYKYIDTMICCSEFMKSKMDSNPLFATKTVAMPTRISASGRFTVTIQNGCDRSGVLGTAAAG